MQKVYALPKLLDSEHAIDYPVGKSFGLYAGPAPTGTKTLPRRVTEHQHPTNR
ncbi:MAG TPA: hypothetical protein VFI54_11550 [Solirubrobacteraceae bacterium]|nr:hypothetical protein [Solirubrobacteraceae bacterium]